MIIFRISDSTFDSALLKKILWFFPLSFKIQMSCWIHGFYQRDLRKQNMYTPHQTRLASLTKQLSKICFLFFFTKESLDWKRGQRNLKSRQFFGYG